MWKGNYFNQAQSHYSPSCYQCGGEHEYGACVIQGTQPHQYYQSEPQLEYPPQYEESSPSSSLDNEELKRMILNAEQTLSATLQRCGDETSEQIDQLRDGIKEINSGLCRLQTRVVETATRVNKQEQQEARGEIAIMQIQEPLIEALIPPPPPEDTPHWYPAYLEVQKVFEANMVKARGQRELASVDSTVEEEVPALKEEKHVHEPTVMYHEDSDDDSMWGEPFLPPPAFVPWIIREPWPEWEDTNLEQLWCDDNDDDHEDETYVPESHHQEQNDPPQAMQPEVATDVDDLKALIMQMNTTMCQRMDQMTTVVSTLAENLQATNTQLQTLQAKVEQLEAQGIERAQAPTKSYLEAQGFAVTTRSGTASKEPYPSHACSRPQNLRSKKYLMPPRH